MNYIKYYVIGNYLQTNMVDLNPIPSQESHAAFYFCYFFIFTNI
jgi:hypothetical protein